MTAISLDHLNAADKAAFIAALGGIFEHAPWVAEEVFAQRPFATLTSLHAAMTDAVEGADAKRRLALMKAHPDLAGKAARAGDVTADSRAEQASAGLDRLSEADYARFHRLNDAYRVRFGIPFIICVRRHTRDSILRQFERRLMNDAAIELNTALGEVFRIAALRLDQHVSAPDRLKVHGRLSTHVLDNHAGRPAQGLWLTLRELPEHDDPRLIVRVSTNTDGRTDAPLIQGQPVPIGRYELLFAVGDYYSELGTPVADPPFLDVVPVRFSVADPEGHYHVPLLVTPWSYSTYRGS